MTQQTDTKRKAAARKAAATRKRNEAARAQAPAEGVKARAEAERQQALAGAYTAARALDASLGGAEAARDRVLQTFERISDPADVWRTSTEDVKRTLGQFESRGAVVRRKIERDLKRRARQAREMVPV